MIALITRKNRQQQAYITLGTDKGTRTDLFEKNNFFYNIIRKLLSILLLKTISLEGRKSLSNFI